MATPSFTAGECYHDRLGEVVHFSFPILVHFCIPIDNNQLGTMGQPQLSRGSLENQLHQWGRFLQLWPSEYWNRYLLENPFFSSKPCRTLCFSCAVTVRQRGYGVPWKQLLAEFFSSIFFLLITIEIDFHDS